MKLANLLVNQEVHVAVQGERHLIDLTQLARREQTPSPDSTDAVILKPDWLEQIARLVTQVGARAHDCRIDPSAVDFAPCILRPPKILCVGLNYRRHALEAGLPVPESPILFSKFHNALAAHGQSIALTTDAGQGDYEAELAVIIGRTARQVPVERALEYVFGYCCCNDVSARDLQVRTSQWLLGKTCDGFLPIGPWLVTRDEIPDPQSLSIDCYVNGERRQHSNTADMVFGIAQIISYASRYMTLQPGDLIATGTPEGVGMGMKPPRWLEPGDQSVVEIAGLGALHNRFAAQP